MRRAIGVSCAAVILAGALVAAWAGDDARGFGGVKPNSTNVYKGDVAGGGMFYFEVKFKRGEPTKMGYVLALSVPVECAEGTTKSSFAHRTLPLDVPVRKRKFALDSGEIQQVGETEVRPFTGSLTGKLDEQGRKASGTLDFGPVDLNDSFRGCSTNGSRTWEAKLSTKFHPH